MKALFVTAAEAPLAWLEQRKACRRFWLQALGDTGLQSSRRGGFLRVCRQSGRKSRGGVSAFLECWVCSGKPWTLPTAPSPWSAPAPPRGDARGHGHLTDKQAGSQRKGPSWGRHGNTTTGILPLAPAGPRPLRPQAVSGLAGDQFLSAGQELGGALTSGFHPRAVWVIKVTVSHHPGENKAVLICLVTLARLSQEEAGGQKGGRMDSGHRLWEHSVPKWPPWAPDMAGGWWAVSCH